ncbi:MAG: pyridoxal-phosphate dependent enzyme [Caldilineales bacterium]|nr:pyridoxal-phosphate dependent enzyme [Caldilineales bacterium]
MPTSPFHLRCRICNQPVDWPPPGARCPRPSCRGALQPRRNILFDPTLIEPAELGMWRYRHLLPPLPDNPITLGEGGTPLLPFRNGDLHLFLKNESLNPTGSYKDRGAAMLINSIGAARLVIDDSSGNAGAALAAYAARAGVRARIYTPAAAPASKQAQISRYGAELAAVPGDRSAVTAAAEEAATEPGVFYASHVWHPGYALAMQTLAWEIWEQLGRRAPHWVVLPVGNGSLLRGLRWGFRSLQKGRLIRELPRLVAAQAAACAPLLAYSRGEYQPHTFQAGPTLADGVAIPHPPLIEAMAAAVRKTNGQVIAVPEEEILPAQDALARSGIFIEPTAALAFAALRHLAPAIAPDHTVVAILTGHGYKTL